MTPANKEYPTEAYPPAQLEKLAWKTTHELKRTQIGGIEEGVLEDMAAEYMVAAADAATRCRDLTRVRAMQAMSGRRAALAFLNRQKEYRRMNSLQLCPIPSVDSGHGRVTGPDDALDPYKSDPLTILLEKEDRELAAQNAENLADLDQQVLQLLHSDGLSQEEAARRLGVGRKVVRGAEERALQKLREGQL